MSTPQPPRRRRIAGESKPAAPAALPKPIKKSRKPAARRSAPESPAKPPPPSPRRPTKAPEPASKPVPEPDVESVEAPTTVPTVARPKKKVEKPEKPEKPEKLPSDKRRRPSAAVVGVALIAVGAVAFGVIFGIRGWNDWHDTHGIVATHDKAAAAASSSAETIFSYRYDKLDDHLDDSKATMTASFAKRFETIAPALNDLAPQRKIQVKASTRDAAAIDCGSKCSPNRADVLVFIDQARLADGAKEPTVFANRVTLKMVKQDGRWLVNDIKAL